MNFKTAVIVALFVSLFFLTSNSFAQYLIEMHSYNLILDHNLMNEEFSDLNEDELKDKLLEMSLSEIKSLAVEDDMEIERNKIYIKGEKAAIETDYEGSQNLKVVIDNSRKMYSVINYDEKTVMEMSLDDSKNIYSNMNKMKSNKGEKEISKSDFKINKTGKTRNINGFDCELYEVMKEEEKIYIWAAEDKNDIGKAVKDFAAKMNEMFQDNDEEDTDEWDYVDGKIPVQVIEFVSLDEVEIELISKIEKQNIQDEKFKVPSEKEGFKHNSMKDMMNKMQDMMNEMYNEENDEE